MPSVLDLRGGFVDSVHPFSAVWVGPRGLRRWGEPFRTPMRSAAKPFQLRASLHALGDPELPLEMIALGTASHAGQPEHVAQVQEILRYFRLEESCLLCGGHAPMHAPSHHALIAAGVTYSAIHNNCSGKHSFMAAACKAQAWDPDYRDANHPLQLAVRDRLSGHGLRPQHGVDGCGVPSWVMELEQMARAWRGLVVDRDPVMMRICRALRERPHLTSGAGQLDQQIMAGAQEPMFVKVGAQGLFCMGFPERKGALVVKVHTGVGAVLPIAVKAALLRFVDGAWIEPVSWNHEVLCNVVGAVVGTRQLQEA